MVMELGGARRDFWGNWGKPESLITIVTKLTSLAVSTMNYQQENTIQSPSRSRVIRRARDPHHAQDPHHARIPETSS